MERRSLRDDQEPPQSQRLEMAQGALTREFLGGYHLRESLRLRSVASEGGTIIPSHPVSAGPVRWPRGGLARDHDRGGLLLRGEV